MVRETLSYLTWGGLTTAVNIAAFFLIRHVPGVSAAAANTSAWFISVVFAFITNRRFVFRSSPARGLFFTSQFIMFIAARLFSGAAETLVIFILIDTLSYADLPVKFFSNSVTVILNYVTGKWLVFRKGAVKNASGSAGDQK